MPRVRCSLPVGLAALLIVLSGAAGGGVGRAAAAEGCGADATLDWLCRQAGEVQIGRVPVRGTAPFQVLPKTRVWVAGAAVARIAFGQEAVCMLGGVSMPTAIVSRYRGSLFLQRNGSTTCGSLSGQETKFGVYCRRTALCPVEVSVDGSVLTEWKSRPALARLGSRPRNREIVLWICGVSYRVAVQRHGNGGEYSGEASGYTFPPQLSVVRIVEFSSYGLGIDGEATGEPCDPQA